MRANRKEDFGVQYPLPYCLGFIFISHTYVYVSEAAVAWEHGLSRDSWNIPSTNLDKDGLLMYLSSGSNKRCYEFHCFNIYVGPKNLGYTISTGGPSFWFQWK